MAKEMSGEKGQILGRRKEELLIATRLVYLISFCPLNLINIRFLAIFDYFRSICDFIFGSRVRNRLVE